MEDLRDELDASVLFGSGYICVVGSPSSGKTTLVLDYLVARERHFNAQHRTTDPNSEMPTFCLEYISARSASNELLRLIMRRLHPDTRQRRLSYECTPLEFGASLVQWLEAHSEGSELHLVVDEADLLDYDVEEMNLWLSHCLRSQAAQTRTMLLWMVSALPLRIANCFRFHVAPRPEPQSIVQWLRQQYEEERHLYVDAEEEEETAEEGVSVGTDAVVPGGEAVRSHTPLITVGPDEVNRVVLEAFTYYATRQPMCTSVVSRDVRLLVQRIYQLLPPLLLESFEGAAGPGTSEERKLNARHFAAAWGQYRSDDSGTTAMASNIGGGDKGTTAAQDPLVLALRRLGYSAVLLAFAAFYGGAVPKRKQHQVFGRMCAGERSALSHDTKGQSHKAAVLTASAHVLTLRRLAFLYDSMLRMCIPHIDPLEFTTADVALQYMQVFVAWGLLTPIVAQRRQSYRCRIPVSTAQRLAHELSLSLFDLIPS